MIGPRLPDLLMGRSAATRRAAHHGLGLVGRRASSRPAQAGSKEAISIIEKTIKDGAAADNLADALEIGYKGFAEIACTDAAKEGISAFLEKRKPEFKS